MLAFFPLLIISVVVYNFLVLVGPGVAASPTDMTTFLEKPLATDLTDFL